ncbi:rhomboid family intramembrane serine protease [Chitinophaga sp. Cy-1792]|uniref:rhomboid family intramembrane serine protease n=1 Tax=Chitinophaga sp. Cy-1792 TaxID=2608339 RepID=UPI0014219084|nr:rhomboid family intramembrane serine protease [Chitinophaga sp. Cy-1792]NIG52302.1 rhomboid family intramembrane serine protease [Chitinophaga sp. Cy-1792]
MNNAFRPRGFHIPTVIKNLLIINGLVWLIQVTLIYRFNYNLSDLFALHYWKSDLFRPWQFVTHLFMHDTTGVGHIGMNMLTLWFFGSTLEDYWGSKRFLLFYLICGMGAAFCYMGWLTYDNIKLTHEAEAFLNNPTLNNFVILDNRYDLGLLLQNYYNMSGMREAIGNHDPAAISIAKDLVYNLVAAYRDMPMVGASGAIYGILFAFGYMFPNDYIYLFFPVKVKYVVGIMIAMELVHQLQSTSGDNVAHVAHLGGALFAFLLLRNWNRKLL